MLAPTLSMASRTPATLWLERLSAMTMSPGRSVGHRKVLIPRQKQGAIDRPIADHRRRQCITAQSCNEGAGFPVPMRSSGPTQRCPRVAASCGRCSSLVQKYQAPGIELGLLLYPACPCRCTSSRACTLTCSVFLKISRHLLSWCHNAEDLMLDAITQTLAHLRQRQIGLCLDPVADHVLHRRQPGDALAALLSAAALVFFLQASMHPMHPHAADCVTTGNGAGALSPLQRSKHSVSQGPSFIVSISSLVCTTCTGEGKD